MQQIRRCTQLICSHQEETNQEKIAELHTEDYRSIRKTQPSNKQKSSLQPKIIFDNTFSFKSCPQNTYNNRHQKQKQSFNYHTILIKDLNKEEFNKKNNEKISMNQHDNIVHLSPQMKIPMSPSKLMGTLHASNSQYSALFPQTSKKKSLKISGACKINNNYQENLQKKSSSKSSDFSTRQSDLITKKQGENFYNICYINRINQENIQLPIDKRQIDQANQICCRDIHKDTKIHQISAINRQQFNKNVTPPNYVRPLHCKSFAKNLQSKVQKSPQALPIKYLSSQFYTSTDKTQQIKDKIMIKNKQSNKILSDSCTTYKSLIESLNQEFFIDKNKMQQKDQNICPINIRNQPQKKIIYNQYVFIEGKRHFQPVIQLQIPNLKNYQYTNHLNKFISGELHLQTKDISLPLTIQFKDLKTVHSIYSQKLQNSYIDINYIQNLKGAVIKLV